jgi:hypothetical protein
MKNIASALLILALPLLGQDKPSENWKALEFLKGTWDAKTAENGAVNAAGTYTFGSELGNHILARHSTSTAGCKGPASYDCEHGDLLYVYEDAPGMPLKAIYFDNEGHVVYELNAAVMSGKFQMKMPGQPDWKTYLEWSGGKK